MSSKLQIGQIIGSFLSLSSLSDTYSSLQSSSITITSLDFCFIFLSLKYSSIDLDVSVVDEKSVNATLILNNFQK